jgi:hypothetical protein
MEDEEMTPETPGEAAEDATAKPLCSPNLLLTLQEAQGQHGLRHGDYARYRCVAGAPAARAASPRCPRVRTADARTAAAGRAGNTARGGCAGSTRCWASRTEARRTASRTGR